MSRWRLDTAFTLILFVASWWTILCLTAFGNSEGMQEPLVNCNEVMLKDRCACNERLLLALTQMKRIVPDPTQFGTAAEANTAIILQQHQQHQLRTYYAPGGCKDASSPNDLPVSVSEQHRGGWLNSKDVGKYLRPLGTECISEKVKDIPNARQLLVGRWQGWQTLFDGKPTPVSLHVISVGESSLFVPPENGPFVRACSDQGSVFGRLRKGYVEFPRSDALGSAYSIRLWNSSAPRSRDLEGVMLLELRPGEVVVAGLVSLSRAVKFPWTTPPSNYYCQDRDLEEQRKDAREQR